MSTPLDLAHLRKVGLNAAEVKTIGFLAKNGGETPWYPVNVKPETRAMIDKLIEKQLVELARHGRLYLRLTDQGRSVAAQLEAMDAAPKIEVASA